MLNECAAFYISTCYLRLFFKYILNQLWKAVKIFVLNVLCRHFVKLCTTILRYINRVQILNQFSNTIKIFYSITGSVIFESKVSALFWAVYLEEFSAEVMSTVVPSAQYLYEELMLTPYMARFVVLHKPHSPHAWCDSLRVICVTDDKAEVLERSSNLFQLLVDFLKYLFKF